MQNLNDLPICHYLRGTHKVPMESFSRLYVHSAHWYECLLLCILHTLTKPWVKVTKGRNSIDHIIYGKIIRTYHEKQIYDRWQYPWLLVPDLMNFINDCFKF